MSRASWSLVLGLCTCAPEVSPQLPVQRPTGVEHFGRPPGMPIGTGGAGAEPEDGELPPDVTDPAVLPIPKFDAASAPPAVPCTGCVELNVYVNDINQRDEFGFGVSGVRVTRVVWTLLVNFNSDQLAVQPFVNDQRGKYTNLHVNTFPLGKPVELEQVFKGKARSAGLVVGSSGAWTGNQTMSVFVDSVRFEGPGGVLALTKSFDAGPAGLEPRTHLHDSRIVFHPEERPAAPAAAAP